MQQSTANNIDQHTIEGGTDDEKKHEKQNINTLLDIAFVLDCTGSMNPYIDSCKDNILSISSTISDQCNNCDVQFALVSYRDIPPQDSTFITKIVNFTPIPFQIQIELSKLSATGGGDAPEALTSALYDCYKNLKWRDKSIKIIIVITDAPPHGLETKVVDGFPNGDIDTFNQFEMEGNNSLSKNNKYLNVIEIVKSIRDDLKAAIYSVACEPDLSCNNDFANDFMQYIAQYTKGKFLPLTAATLLPNVIVGSVKQQINLNNLTYKLDEEIQKIKQEYGNDISSAEINKIIMAKWKDAGIKKKDISIGTLYKKERSKYNINLLMNEQKIKSLKDFKQHCKLFKRLTESDFRHLNVDNNNSNNSNNVTPPITPPLIFSEPHIKTTSIMEPRNVKISSEVLERMFDEYIDLDRNGDVDVFDWFVGMEKLNVDLTQMQQRKVFNLINKNDGDGYITKNDFIMFGMDELDNFVDEQDECLVFGYVRHVKMSVWMEVSEIILLYYCMNVVHELQEQILQAVRIKNACGKYSGYMPSISLATYIEPVSPYRNSLYTFAQEMHSSPRIMGNINGGIINNHFEHEYMNYNSHLIPQCSPDCAPQRVYSREASLSLGDMEDFRDRLKMYKSEYD